MEILKITSVPFYNGELDKWVVQIGRARHAFFNKEQAEQFLVEEQAKLARYQEELDEYEYQLLQQDYFNT